MRNRQKDFMFSYLISGFEKSMQATLNAMYAKSNMIDEENHRREMEQMKKEIADDIMSRLSATVDVSEIIDQIKELRRAIDDLGRNT